MLTNVEICHYPRTVDEVVRLLGERGDRLLLLAGGTTAGLSRDERVRELVDLTALELDAIEEAAGGWRLGATARLQQVAAHPDLGGYLGGLVSEAARSVGSRPIRNMATVGGNAVQVFRWSDPPVAYLAAEAEFELSGPGGKRLVPAEQFYARHPRRVLEAQELLTTVCLPATGTGCAGAFVKLSRTAFDLALVNCAARVTVGEQSITEARIVLGGFRTLPWRCREAEQAVLGKRPGERRLERLAGLVAERLPLGKGLAADQQAFLRQLAGQAARRALEKAWQRASGREQQR